RAGVDLTGVKRVGEAATALSMIVVRPDGEKTIILAPNANDAWDDTGAGDVAKAIENAPEGSVLVVDLEVPEDAVRRAMTAARERGLRVVLDPSPADRMPEDLFAFVDAITPNPSEAQTLTGIEISSADDAERAGQELLRRGVGAACMKLPDGGCVVVADNVHERIDPVEVDVVDTTGAGDAFAGALGVALLDGMEIVPAARFAVATSHLAVTAYGSQESYPARDEVERMLDRLGNGG
ncbi:MAG TPA: PfkB family carbohydrate kinase, partial [Thermomicrobiales bacterium]|nr:PfkB family carbohydrate kinase [Thermomicrobiales bacterium]